MLSISTIRRLSLRYNSQYVLAKISHRPGCAFYRYVVTRLLGREVAVVRAHPVEPPARVEKIILLHIPSRASEALSYFTFHPLTQFHVISSDAGSTLG